MITEPILPNAETVIEISSEYQDPTRILYVDSCYLTENDPSDSSNENQTKTHLLKNGLPVHQFTSILKNNQDTHVSIKTKLFEIVTSYPQVFVTCHAEYCDGFCDVCVCPEGVPGVGSECSENLSKNGDSDFCVECDTGLVLENNLCVRNCTDLTWGTDSQIFESKLLGYTEVRMNMDVEFEFTSGVDVVGPGWRNILHIGNSDNFRQPSLFLGANSMSLTMAWNQHETWRQVGVQGGFWGKKVRKKATYQNNVF